MRKISRDGIDPACDLNWETVPAVSLLPSRIVRKEKGRERQREGERERETVIKNSYVSSEGGVRG